VIAAVVLYAFGTGSVRGFALTLGISVVTSMFTAVFVTHKLLDIFVDLGVKNQKLYI
jgi:preprotein translocase subunit SecD